MNSNTRKIVPLISLGATASVVAATRYMSHKKRSKQPKVHKSKHTVGFVSARHSNDALNMIIEGTKTKSDILSKAETVDFIFALLPQHEMKESTNKNHIANILDYLPKEHIRDAFKEAGITGIPASITDNYINQRKHTCSADPVLTPHERLRFTSKHKSVRNMFDHATTPHIHRALTPTSLADNIRRDVINEVGPPNLYNSSIKTLIDISKKHENIKRSVIHSIAKNSERYWSFVQALQSVPQTSYETRFAKENCIEVTERFLNHVQRKVQNYCGIASIQIFFDASGTDEKEGYTSNNKDYTTLFQYNYTHEPMRSKSHMPVNEWFTYNTKLSEARSSSVLWSAVAAYICANFMHLKYILIKYCDVDWNHIYTANINRISNKITDLPPDILQYVLGPYLNTEDALSYQRTTSDSKTAQRILVHSIAKNSKRYWTFLQALNDTSPNVSERAKAGREMCYATTARFMKDALHYGNTLHVANKLVFMFILPTPRMNFGIPAGTFPNDSLNFTAKFVYRQKKSERNSDNVTYHRWHGHIKEYGDRRKGLKSEDTVMSEHDVVQYVCNNYMYIVDVFMVYGMGKVHSYGTTRPRGDDGYAIFI
jgi:formiminotetrahydrofolate cyclodeaminase